MNGAPAPAALTELRAQIDATMGSLPLAAGTTASAVDAGGVPAILCQRHGFEDKTVFVYFHGGGYRLGSAVAWRAYGSHLAAACEARVLLVDYRLAPEHPFPAAVQDAVAAYTWALDQAGDSASVIIGGDSAGGGLAAALLLAAREQELALPAGAVCLSPWVDLTNEAGTYSSNAERDTLFSKAAADEAATLYLGGGDRTIPLASPVFGAWEGMPPVLIQVGDTEVLLDDAARLAQVARDGGGEVEHHVYPDMLHVWQLQYPALPEAVTAVEEIASFVGRVAKR